MFSPNLKASMSLMVMLSRPPPRSRSSSRFFKPLMRFSPPVSIVASTTAGFVMAKLAGDKALTN